MPAAQCASRAPRREDLTGVCQTINRVGEIDAERILDFVGQETVVKRNVGEPGISNRRHRNPGRPVKIIRADPRVLLFSFVNGLE